MTTIWVYFIHEDRWQAGPVPDAQRGWRDRVSGRGNPVKWSKRSRWIAEEAEIRPVQAVRGWVHPNPSEAPENCCMGLLER